ncbi:MAG: carbon-nitrogen hydrolase family protein [Pseudohongiellaceae bacterium]
MHPHNPDDRQTVIAAVQMVSVADVAANLRAAEDLIARAVEQQASLVALPENFAVLDSGPMREFGERWGDDGGPLQQFLAGQARRHGIWLLGGTIPLITRPQDDSLLEDGRVRPASLLYDPAGQCRARYDKIHLFDVDVDDAQASYRESDSFEPGDQAVVADTPFGGLGLTVCYDLRFPGLYRVLSGLGAELVTVPSAFTRVTGEAHWESLIRARAIENQVYVLAPGQGGQHNAKRTTWGHSMIVDPWGTVLACHEDGEGVAVARIDPDMPGRLRSAMPVARHHRNVEDDGRVR